MKFRYLPILAAVFFLFACTNEIDGLEVRDEPARVGKFEKMSFKVAVPGELGSATVTRSSTPELKDMLVFVFDHNKKCLYVTDAEFVDVDENDYYSFEVELEITEKQLDDKNDKLGIDDISRQRTLHFVANYKDISIPHVNDLEGRSEYELIGLMESSSEAYWASKTFSRIGMNTLGNAQIELLRNHAQIEVVNHDANFRLHGFAVLSYMDKSSVAPYTGSYSGIRFMEKPEQPTIPTGAKLIQKKSTPNFQKDPVSIFEYKNSTRNPFTILIKGHFVGTVDDVYIKFNFYPEDEKSQRSSLNHILRNHKYTIHLDKLAKFSSYETAQEAISSPASDGGRFDISGVSGVINSDSKILSVSKSYILLAQPNQDFDIDISWANFTGEIAVETSWDNDYYLSKLTQSSEGYNKIKLSGQLKRKSTSKQEYSIKITAGYSVGDEKMKNITHTVYILVVPPVEFDYKVKELPEKSDGHIYFGVYITAPEDIPDEFYPLPLRIKSPDAKLFVPKAHVVLENGEIYYDCFVHKDEYFQNLQLVFFLNEKNKSSVSATLESPYFNPTKIWMIPS